MGTYYHRLKGNKTGAEPRNWCYVDCEAVIHRKPDGSQEQFLDFGWACFVQNEREGRPERVSWHRFETTREFWEWLNGLMERDRRTILCAYNLGYDFRILNGFHELAALEWKQTKIYASEAAVILGFRKGRARLDCLDAMNWLTGKLERWGDLLGIPKFSVDLAGDDRLKVSAYCHRDVEILRAAVEYWRKFRIDHDLGCFAPTKAAQAFTAYRHRFMKTPVWVHANPDATNLERESYHGGRVECRWLGEVPDSPVYKLDINSLYPAMMASRPVPTKLLGFTSAVGVDWLRRDLGKRCACARVAIETDVPMYPVMLDDTLAWPIGRFETVLIGDELKEALRRGHIVDVREVAVYEQSVIFKDYVREFYRLRKHYQHHSNEVYETLCKYMLNGLSGKFGQLSADWHESEPYPGETEGMNPIVTHGSHNLKHRYVIAGQAWEVAELGESAHSCVAIIAAITASARMRLWGLMEQAGWGNWYYCDTDSLFVNRAGYFNLIAEIDPDRLGYLKVESVARSVVLHGPKDYVFDDEVKLKGVRPSAVEIEPGVYQTEQWENLRGAIGAGRTDRVVIRPMTKRMRRNYTKGHVSESGEVFPLMIDLDASR